MNIAILGLGIVGKGVYDILANNFDGINVKYILERDHKKLEGIKALKANSFEDIINDKDVDVIVELIGGKSIAYEFIKKALNHKKHVVTANKALISDKYEELTKLASKNDVALLFEASVGGGIIVLDILNQISKIEKIQKIEGILNGSTNYILSKIFKDNYSMNQALEEATKLGYLEKGSNDDIEGLDSLRKINILSMIAYDTYLNENDIICNSLSKITTNFINHLKSKGLILKYIATSELVNDSIFMHIEPVIIDDNQISTINYEENMISFYGKYHNKQSFIGQGAGRYPTASAIVYDLLKIKNNVFSHLELKHTYSIDKKLRKYHFLVEKNNVIYKTDLVDFEDIINDLDIICFARIEDGVYEKI